ncbi:MAG TPA: fatty acyl-AMP ligase [Solirubrobacteraceae bacterium]|nr:fatty acyl-AMP ligase [Solirubrobacteraceae bacterium]
MPSSFADILSQRAREDPDATAFVFEGEERVSYAELDARARTIAAALADARGERVLLVYPPGLEYVAAMFGCFYAGVVAVPAYPPDPARLERSLPRLEAIIRDAEPKVVLTIEVLTGLVGGNTLATDTLPPGSWSAPVESGDVALLQYTSGSTAEPRGVMLTHANLLHNSDFIRRAFGNTERSCGVIWLPPYHDMGLIGGILQPVFVGFPCHLMSPFTMLQRPVNWLRAISEHGGTVSGGPNFAFELCLRRIDESDRAELDLSSWEIAFNGSEPVRPETIDAFSEMFAQCGFRREAFFPCYGLAEGTLMVTGGERLAGPRLRRHGDKDLVGCGRPDPEHQVVIVDPAGEPLGEGEEGEICVTGPSVAAGYWRDGSFGPLLRTGDLGLLADGELYVTGRIKELVIVAGRNHHALDIELACERAVPQLRRGCGAAFSYDGTGREQIGVVYEVRDDPELDADAVIRAMRQAVTSAVGAGVGGIALIPPRSIPKTSSGKVQRGVCRARFTDGTLPAVAQWQSA